MALEPEAELEWWWVVLFMLEEMGGETEMDMDAKSEIPERWIGCPRSASACAGSWRTE